MFSAQSTAKIVESTEIAINEALSTQCAAGWTLSLLVDKPATGEVYLLFTKPCVTVEQPAP